MKKFFLSAAVITVFSAGSAEAAVIDQMYTATFGHYSQSQTVGGNFMIFSQADYYRLSDGSSWNAGAGWAPSAYSTVASTQVANGKIRYTFNAPASGILFQNIDYDNGDHSAQGVLDVFTPLVIEADLGSTTGKMIGYTTIESNDATWYGEPRFNFYDAKVGDKVYFEQDYSLLDTTFTENLFQHQFEYNESGVVDFTRVAGAVPEPASLFLMLAGLTAIGVYSTRRKQG